METDIVRIQNLISAMEDTYLCRRYFYIPWSSSYEKGTWRMLAYTIGQECKRYYTEIKESKHELE